MIIKNLMLEVTRKCNLQCEHCLRGDAQDKSMTSDVMVSLFQHISHIEMLTIGGGEPSLAIDVINNIHQCLVQANVTIGDVFLVTNGKDLSYPLLKAFNNLYGLVENHELSGFAISNDTFHKQERGFYRHPCDYQDMIDYPFDLDDLEDEDVELELYNLNQHDFKINEHTSEKSNNWWPRGRAKGKSFANHKDEPYLDCLVLDDIKHPTTIMGQMYVCYNGDVVGDMNMAYEDIPNYLRGNVKNWSNLIKELEKSTIQNYKWCKQNCNYFDDCSDTWDNVSLETIEHCEINKELFTE